MLVFLLLALLPCAVSIGISVPPVLIGDKKKYSSPRNLENCVSYLTSKDDIITVTIKSGDKLTSQLLNLNVFDSQKNALRSLEDLSGDQMVMFTNLGYQDTSPDHSWKRLLDFHDKKTDEFYDQLPLVPEKTYVHICFDNVYSDKSWSFQKQPRELSMTIDIRSLASLRNTNYKEYAKHFTKISDTENNDEDAAVDRDFSEENFESAIKKLEHLLNEVSEELKDSQIVAQNLKRSERRLRDLNEKIFENYIKTATLLLFTIASLGLIQLSYYKFYFKRRKLI